VAYPHFGECGGGEIEILSTHIFFCQTFAGIWWLKKCRQDRKLQFFDLHHKFLSEFLQAAANMRQRKLWMLKMSILLINFSETGVFIPKLCIFGKSFSEFWRQLPHRHEASDCILMAYVVRQYCELLELLDIKTRQSSATCANYKISMQILAKLQVHL